MVQQAGIQHTKGSGSGQKKKSGKKGKGPELVFDETARAEYLTGFHKRKQERKEAGREHLAKKAKEELLVQRKEARKARRDQAAENVRNERKAFGLEGEGESDLDGDDAAEDDAPSQQEEEYDSDQHHTHVTVESFDPEEAAFAQVTSLAPKSQPDKGESSTANAAKNNGKGKETNHSHKEENGTSQQQLKERRLLVSGLTSAFTQAEVAQRFAAFGTVVAVDCFGKRDANGDLRPFAYITLRATEAQTRRCMNLLSGSMWKGAKLRIGEAKPDYQERWLQAQKQEEEKRTQQDREHRAKLKRKRLPPGTALESPYLSESITKHHLEQGYAWGWKQSSEGYLVRPLRIRPDHPLPKPQPLALAAEAESTRQKARRLTSRPPSKAHRITIDPTRYGVVHLSAHNLDESPAAGAAVDVEALGPGEWHCQEIDDDDRDDAQTIGHRLVRWQYVGTAGLVLHEEFAKLPVRIVVGPSLPQVIDHDDETGFMDDFDRYSAAPSDDLFSDFPTKTPATGPSNARTEVDDLFSDFPVSRGSKANNESSRSEETSNLFSEVSTSFHAPAVVQADVTGTFVPGLDPDEYNDPDYFSDGYDEGPPPFSGVTLDNEGERQSTLKLIAQMFGTSPAPGQVGHASAPDVKNASSNSSTHEGDSPSSSSDVEAPEQMQEEVSSSSPSSTSEDESDAQDEEEQSPSHETDHVDDNDAEHDEAPSRPDAGMTLPTAQTTSSVQQKLSETPTAQVNATPQAETGIVAKEGVKPTSRRAAFLHEAVEAAVAAATSDRNNAGADPRVIPRFDPGPLPRSMPSVHHSTNTSANPIADSVTAVEPRPGAQSQNTSVAFSSLKAMFQPQQASASADGVSGFAFSLDSERPTKEQGEGGDGGKKGFSIMDALGLELDLELDLDHEQDEPVSLLPPPPTAAVEAGAFQGLHPARAAMLNPTAAQPSLASMFFFLSTPTTVPTAQLRKSNAEITANWTRRKNLLTSQIKKRHREAVKKRKRRVGAELTRSTH